MNIVVTSKKPVRTAERGTLPTGIPVEVSEPLGKFLIEQGVAALVETKNAPEPAPEPAPEQPAALEVAAPVAIKTVATVKKK